MPKNIAVLLAGCGNRDGAEITEAVSVLIALSEVGANYTIFAPDKNFEATNFLTGALTGQTRNVLQEAARIARGKIRDARELRAEDFDALVIPGGAGAAVHLGPDAERLIPRFYEQEKPIGAICIAPTLVARVLGPKGITVTLGADGKQIADTGAQHEACAADDFVTDRAHRIVTTPAYMHPDATPFEVFTGVRKAIRELVEMA